MDDTTWIYAVWFRDARMPPDEQDYEWLALIAIPDVSAERAREWGDHLAHRRAGVDAQFLWSEVRRPSDPVYSPGGDWSTVPVVRYGVEATDDEIGW
jgi:hypothetical protein